MNATLQNSTSITDNRPSEERTQSPPAFLDLADSAARLGTNMPDISARVELKRLEHERQRLIQRKMFEDQMRALEQQQAQELLSIPYDPNASNGGGLQHLAVSAPTTPPRVNADLNGDVPSGHRPGLSQHVDAESLSKAVGFAASDKRKSVTYSPSVNPSPELPTSSNSNGFARNAGAKSMPASRRTSASSHDENLASHLQGLSMVGERTNRVSPVPRVVSHTLQKGAGRYGDEERAHYGKTFNAGMMLDEQLDQEMHNAMRNLPTSDNDKYHNTYSSNVSTSSAALDLAHMSQAVSRTSLSGRTAESREKSSEWPQFSGPPRGPDGITSVEKRNVTNPNLTISSHVGDLSTSNKLGGTVSASSTPLGQQHPQGISAQTHGQIPSSRRSSPPGMPDGLGATTRSVPATPLGLPGTAHNAKRDGTPHIPGSEGLSSRLTSQGSQAFGDNAVNAGDLQASLSRVPPGQYENSSLTFSSVQSTLDDSLQYGVDSVYGIDDDSFNSYGFESGGRPSSNMNSTSGSTALYHHNGSRYGLGLPARTNPGAVDSKMNGLHGPKHKRGDVDREFNRFAGTRLEDLQGEIPALCKDQHGCRYLQKKLEEGVPEHRDMIFRETFGHFADLMTDPFGNYLCQKLLEYSTDEQRNVICESVAQDLVNISLNMHGTRAVQKMIDFLSTRRQADHRYDTQIRSIIIALSLHVVVLIKDLNGNHVIQKCLNKLAPEDNQFIYNAVAANCVEVATHRHGCCVLQRCIDHASDHQRIQLVNEITYNALTLVQDPYGNYVVQYILDLNDNRFSDAVIRQFTGNICALSVQKFSSNVIEKCVRVAEHRTRKMLIEELLNRTRLEKLLRDSYGNYCVQTALDYAEPAQRAMLVEGIRPVLPLIRNTPYGKRIQNKLQREQMDHFGGGGGYHNQQALVNMTLGSQGMGLGAGRHINQGLHQVNPLNEVYSGQNGVYSIQGQGSFGQNHMSPQLHGIQPQSIDGYVLQGTSSHNQAMSPSLSHGGGFSGGPSTFANVSAFGNIGFGRGSLNDPYQRSSFGYGM